MIESVKKEFKKSNIEASTEFEFYQIQRKSNYLIDCIVQREMDEVCFEFLFDTEKSFHRIKELPRLSIYQALLNIEHLFLDSQRLNISLHPDNLYFDTNMMPKAMMRDVYEENDENKNKFVLQYKALIGCMLQSKYSFDDFHQGGNQLLTKNKNTMAFVNASSVEEIIELLYKEYRNLQEKLQYSMIEVDKKKFKSIRFFNKITILLLIVSISLGGYFGFFRLKETSTINKSNEFFIKQDYISVLTTLKDVKISRMNSISKYIYAVSNIKTETLNEEQKNNILSNIAFNSDTRILEFWIHLGKSDLNEAIDVAKQLGNKEYLAFGYMKQQSQIENDKDISGEERDEKLKAVEENLKSLELMEEQSIGK